MIRWWAAIVSNFTCCRILANTQNGGVRLTAWLTWLSLGRRESARWVLFSFCGCCKRHQFATSCQVVWLNGLGRKDWAFGCGQISNLGHGWRPKPSQWRWFITASSIPRALGLAGWTGNRLLGSDGVADNFSLVLTSQCHRKWKSP